MHTAAGSGYGHATPPKLGSALISPTYVHLLPPALDSMRPVRDKSESDLGGTSSLSRESIPGPLNQPMGLGMG